GAQAGARMGAGPDVVNAPDRRAVARKRRARPPEQVLVERAGAGVDVAADEVHVGALDVGRREDDALQESGLEIGYVARDSGLDAAGVSLLELVRPGAVARVDLARGVACGPTGQLLKLDPEDALALGRARRIDRKRLADDDSRLCGKQPALRLVHRARHAVEP